MAREVADAMMLEAVEVALPVVLALRAKGGKSAAWTRMKRQT